MQTPRLLSSPSLPRADALFHSLMLHYFPLVRLSLSGMYRLTLSLTTLARSSLGTVALLSVDPTQELSVFLLSIGQLFRLVGKFCLAVGSP